MQLYLFLGLLFSIAIAVFAVQNSVLVDISVFFWKFKDISLVLVIFGSALIGALAAGLFGAVKQYKYAKNLKNCKTLLENSETEVQYLRSKLGRETEAEERQETKGSDLT